MNSDAFRGWATLTSGKPLTKETIIDQGIKMTGQETIDDIARDFRKAMNQKLSVPNTTTWPKIIVFPKGYFLASATIYEDGSVDLQPHVPINWIDFEYNSENTSDKSGEVDIQKYIAFLDETKKLAEKYNVVVKMATQERQADVEISLPILTPKDEKIISFKIIKNKDKK